MAGTRRSNEGKRHRFGGDWTTAKLDVLSAYLKSYTTALRDKPSKANPFVKAYIDAFAGTGYRDAHGAGSDQPSDNTLLFPDLAQAEPQRLLDGSARLALKTTPRFDRYIFIERSPARCAQLAELRTEFHDLASDIDIRQGDANDKIHTSHTLDCGAPSFAIPLRSLVVYFGPCRARRGGARSRRRRGGRRRRSARRSSRCRACGASSPTGSSRR